MATIKANQPTLFDQVKSLPGAQVPIGAQTRETGHGRKETRTVKALTVQTSGGQGFPKAEQAVRITRTRRHEWSSFAEVRVWAVLLGRLLNRMDVLFGRLGG